MELFPSYDGSCHPDDWFNNLKFVAALHGISSETVLVDLALLKISRAIRNNSSGSITKLSQVIDLLKADSSYKIFKLTSEKKLSALRFTHLCDVRDFIVELRQLLSDAEIFNLSTQKQYIAKILSSEMLANDFSSKIANATSVDEVFIKLQKSLYKLKRVVKYGSVIALRHIDTNKILSSTLNKYSGGSKQYWVFAKDGNVTDFESWTIMPEVIVLNTPPKYGDKKEKGSLVYYGDKITLKNNGTGHKLHSHCGPQSPVTSQQEVSCQTWNNFDDNWIVQHNIYDIDPEKKEPLIECHDIVFKHIPTNSMLCSHKYMLNNNNQEVTCFGYQKINLTKWHIEILDM
ncbi:28559_t:CDS:2 [Dentiscutata erythropus]|uniref:28559_t:CDS:1 n=1 Tax=Dentiscutata erythropus TaxID=1348616 RepID=A0A9N9NHI4_9GLOM|nr:28559_t:CDS:2 [Dentiscutata erythropus]